MQNCLYKVEYREVRNQVQTTESQVGQYVSGRDYQLSLYLCIIWLTENI